jgi:excisionase family DNA binding protein
MPLSEFMHLQTERHFFANPMRLIQKLSSNPEPLLTTAAVAKWLGVATRTVCLWAECEEIPAVKIGRQWRFREGELRQWLDSPQSAKVGMGASAKAHGATA